MTAVGDLYRSNHGWADRQKPFEVMVDGATQARIFPREHVDFRVPLGRHRITVT